MYFLAVIYTTLFTYTFIEVWCKNALFSGVPYTSYTSYSSSIFGFFFLPGKAKCSSNMNLPFCPDL